jgi:hypothetical protein
MLRRARTGETIRGSTKPFSAFAAELRKRLLVIKPTTKRRPRRSGKGGDS